MKIPRLYIFFIFILFNLVVFSAEEPLSKVQNFHKWGSVTLFNGMPSDNVRAIAQTGDGLLWFGTDNGLVKFDGRRITAIYIKEAISVNDLKLSKTGTLWIATDKGIFYFKNGEIRSLKDVEGLSINALFVDEKIWFAVKGAVYVVDETGQGPIISEKIRDEKFSARDNEPLPITSLAKIKNGLLVATHGRGVLSLENGVVTELSTLQRPYFVNELLNNGSNDLYIGTRDGLFKNITDKQQRISIADGLNITALTIADSDTVYAGTESVGILEINADKVVERFTFENTSGGLRSNRINKLFVDNEGVLWAGTDRGVVRYDKNAPENKVFSNQTTDNFIRTLIKDDKGDIYAGTNIGVFKFNGIGWDQTLFGRRIVVGLDQLRGNLFASTFKGLIDQNGKDVISGDARSAVNFQGQSYVSMIGKGLVKLSDESVVFADESVTTLKINDGKLLIGTGRNGVFVYDGVKSEPITSAQKLVGQPIWKIVNSDDGKLWFACGNGLYSLRDQKLEEITSGIEVRDVVIRDENIWAATVGSGLLHIRDDENFGRLKTSLSIENGLLSEKVFSLLPIDDGLMIGTSRGISIFKPNQTAPKIQINRVLSQRLHDQSELTQNISLEYPQNSLLIEISGLSTRTFPEDFQYAFFLKDQNGKIINQQFSKESQFAPVDLKPGTYHIESYAINKALIPSEKVEVSFSVAKAPFPWTATALGVLLVIALIGLIWAVSERIRIIRKNRELAAARFDLANEAERERRRIARDLHDQTLADLRELMLKTDDLPGGAGDFRGEIELVSTEIRRICEDLSPSVLENVGMLPALEFLLKNTMPQSAFIADDSLAEKLDMPANVQMQIYRITQEVLNNLKKHSTAQKIKMTSFVENESDIVFQLIDDGDLFDPEKAEKKGRGLANIRSRSELISAHISRFRNETNENVFELRMKR